MFTFLDLISLISAIKRKRECEIEEESKCVCVREREIRKISMRKQGAYFNRFLASF